MAAKKASPAMDFIVDQLKKDTKASYADIKAAAEKKGLSIFPIMFGRAQALLNIVKSKPRGQGKAAMAKAASNREASSRETSAVSASSGGEVKRGPGRPRKVPMTGIDTSSLDGIISAVKSSEAAKARYRAALEKIQQILGAALDS